MAGAEGVSIDARGEKLGFLREGRFFLFWGLEKVRAVGLDLKRGREGDPHHDKKGNANA